MLERFEIRVPDALLADLHLRLERTRFPDTSIEPGWTRGTDLRYLREVCDTWCRKFDWRAWERRLNAWDHYRTPIDGLDLHFIHAPSRHADAMPLLITHGWPGSIVEFHRILEPLRDPTAFGGDAGDAFHVVCPSLPGYGWSDAPHEPGWDARRIAAAEAALMDRLGYDRYGAHGGDWGSIISAWIGASHPDRVAGIHLTMPVAMPPSGDADPMQDVTPEELTALAQLNVLREEFVSIAASNPDTIAVALNDSPAGLAAWILHKFWRWSGGDDDLETHFERDDLLANVTVYWVTGTIGSSLGLYHATRAAGRLYLGDRVRVPTGCAIAPAEPYRVPRAWIERQYDVCHWTRLERGGHFLALEEPEALVDDIRTFFRDLRRP